MAIVEFVDKEIEALQEKIASKLGYKLVDHKLELYGLKNKKINCPKKYLSKL